MPECSGNNQLGRPGEPLEPFMATFHDPDGEAIWGMPVKFVQVTGGGKLEVSSATTDQSGGVCAELIPDCSAKRGRVELHYGENLEQMIPFIYSMEGVQEEEAVPLPTPTPVAPVIEAIQPPIAGIISPKPVAVPARKPKPQQTTARITRPATPAKTQRRRFIGPDWIKSSVPRSKTIPLMMVIMFIALTIPVYGLVSGVSPLFHRQAAAVEVELIADCTKGTAPHAVGHQLVYDNCPLFRKSK